MLAPRWISWQANFRAFRCWWRDSSFGCWVGLRQAARDGPVKSADRVGAPVNNVDFSYLLQCSKPKLFVHGENDQFGDPEKLKKLVAMVPGENRVVIVEAADHFFVGKLDQVDTAITNWMRGARGFRDEGES